MKLMVRPQPEEYAADKAIIMNDENDRTILLSCPQAQSVAREVAHRVNLYDSMVTVLAIFGSGEMGQMIIDNIVNNPPAKATAEDIAMVKDRMTRLIGAVDVILKGIELHKEIDNV